MRPRTEENIRLFQNQLKTFHRAVNDKGKSLLHGRIIDEYKQLGFTDGGGEIKNIDAVIRLVKSEWMRGKFEDCLLLPFSINVKCAHSICRTMHEWMSPLLTDWALNSRLVAPFTFTTTSSTHSIIKIAIGNHRNNMHNTFWRAEEQSFGMSIKFSKPKVSRTPDTNRKAYLPDYWAVNVALPGQSVTTKTYLYVKKSDYKEQPTYNDLISEHISQRSFFANQFASVSKSSNLGVSPAPPVTHPAPDDTNAPAPPAPDAKAKIDAHEISFDSAYSAGSFHIDSPSSDGLEDDVAGTQHDNHGTKEGGVDKENPQEDQGNALLAFLDSPSSNVSDVAGTQSSVDVLLTPVNLDNQGTKEGYQVGDESISAKSVDKGNLQEDQGNHSVLVKKAEDYADEENRQGDQGKTKSDDGGEKTKKDSIPAGVDVDMEDDNQDVPSHFYKCVYVGVSDSWYLLTGWKDYARENDTWQEAVSFIERVMNDDRNEPREC